MRGSHFPPHYFPLHDSLSKNTSLPREASSYKSKKTITSASGEANPWPLAYNQLLQAALVLPELEGQGQDPAWHLSPRLRPPAPAEGLKGFSEGSARQKSVLEMVTSSPTSPPRHDHTTTQTEHTPGVAEMLESTLNKSQSKRGLNRWMYCNKFNLGQGLKHLSA